MPNLNPFELLDSILADYASPKARRTLHTLLLLGAALVTIWFTADGDWRKALAALAVSLYASANKANTGIGPDQPIPDEHEHALWAEQPVHVDDIIPRTTEHDASDLYGDGADRGGNGSEV